MGTQIYHGTAAAFNRIIKMVREPAGHGTVVSIPDSQQGDITYQALVHYLLGKQVVGHGAMREGYAELYSCLTDRLGNLFAFPYSKGHYLLRKYVLSCLGSGYHYLPMHVGRGIDDHRVNIVPAKQGIQIRFKCGTDLLGVLFASFGDFIPNRRNFYIIPSH